MKKDGVYETEYGYIFIWKYKIYFKFYTFRFNKFSYINLFKILPFIKKISFKNQYFELNLNFIKNVKTFNKIDLLEADIFSWAMKIIDDRPINYDKYFGIGYGEIILLSNPIEKKILKYKFLNIIVEIKKNFIIIKYNFKDCILATNFAVYLSDSLKNENIKNKIIANKKICECNHFDIYRKALNCNCIIIKTYEIEWDELISSLYYLYINDNKIEYIE